MKVLVSDNLGEIGVEMFQEAQGIEVDVKTGLSPEELKSIIGEYHALVIRSATKVTRELLAAAKIWKLSAGPESVLITWISPKLPNTASLS